MKLNNETLKNRADWEAKGYRLPEYDRVAMMARTKENQLVADLLPLVESDVRGQRMSAYIGAQKLLDAYFNMLRRE